MRVWDETWGALDGLARRRTRSAAGWNGPCPRVRSCSPRSRAGRGSARLRRGPLNAGVWKRRLRSGSVRLGGVELTWDVHSARRRPLGRIGPGN